MKINDFSKITVILNSKTRLRALLEGKKDPVRVDSPHVPGDSKHAHYDLGKYQITYDYSGQRKHKHKFPPDQKITKPIKQAIATKLKIDPDTLEAYMITDETGEMVLILEQKP